MPNFSSIKSNYAADVAQRNLRVSSAQVAKSVAKLSSGNRIVTAQDDAAGLAIGSALRASVASLKQAQVSVGQGTSMLQTADGGYSAGMDLLVRMKTLAVQASSADLGTADRAKIDLEYQELEAEIGRIAASTEFNNNAILAGGYTFSAIGDALSNTATSFAAGSDGITNMTFNGETFSATNANTFLVSYANATRVFTVTMTTTADAGEADVYAGVLAGSADNFSGVVVLQGGDGDGTETLSVTFSGYAAGSSSSGTTAQLSFTVAASGTSSYTFRAGDDMSANGEISVTFDSMTVAGLSLTGLDLTTSANAETAAAAIDTAIGTVASARAKVGAGLSRFEFADGNLSSLIENTAAAQSSLLDLNIAQEISVFTSKQILVQAGVSMLSQAQSLPQNLLALLQP